MRVYLSRYRDELKGLAILWVALFHAEPAGVPVLGWLARYGYGGVDLLMLLLGFGLYRSLEARPGVADYYKRRAARLLPSYWPFCALWLAVMLPLRGGTALQSVRVALANLLMIGTFAGVRFTVNWYLDLLLVSVLLAPAIALTLARARRRGLCLLGWLTLLTLGSVAFWGAELTILFSRLPIFALGIGLAALPDTGRPGRAARAAVGLAAFAAGAAVLWLFETRYPAYLNDCGMYWYPFFLIAPALCAGLGWLMERAGGLPRLLAPLRFVGRASFEVFLFNAWAELLAAPLGLAGSVAGRLALALASVLLGCLYHIAVKAAVGKAAGRGIAA